MPRVTRARRGTSTRYQTASTLDLVSHETPVHVVIQTEPSGAVYFHAKWRRRLPDGTSRQVKRSLGPAWLERGSDGWVKRKGRTPDGYLDERTATVKAAERRAEVEAAWEAEQASKDRPTVAVLFDRFLDHRERVKGTRPGTLRDYRSVLLGEYLAELRKRPAAEVDPAEVEAVLAAVAETGASARTVNKYRAILSAAWAWGMRPTGLKLPENPAKGTDRRREPARRTVDWYSVEEVEQLARTMASSDYRTLSDPKSEPENLADGADAQVELGPKRKLSERELEHRALCEQQDPQLIRLAAYAGLRLSEIVALTWDDVDFARRFIHVRSAVSGGQIVDSPKSGKHRQVPMSDRALVALDTLGKRRDFTGPADYVAVSALGERLQADALSRRFNAARDHAGLRELVFHHLRHTFGSMAVAGGVDLAQVKAAMGHSKIETTERYLHAKSGADVAAAFTRAQQGADPDHESRQGATSTEERQHESAPARQ